MSKSVLSDLDFQGYATATGLRNPAAASDAATKQYVDSAVEGLSWKDSVRVATQANINLSSPGGTVDGVTMSPGDRVLVRNQTQPQFNGLYIWSGPSIAMTRSSDASSSNALENAVVTVEEGTSAGATFRQTSVNFVIDTDAIAWGTFGSAAGAASESTPGVAEIATQGETDAGTDDQRFITPAKLAAYAGRAKRTASDIGDGSATQYTFTHNLNTRDLGVMVRRNSGNYDQVLCDIDFPTVNSVRLTFNQAPSVNQFRVIVIA